MNAADARAALEAATGAGVTVAVVDSGWGAAGGDTRVRRGEGEPGQVDALGHGTLCAARVLQVAPGAEVVAIQVFRSRLETSVAELCSGIERALAAGVDVINLSLATRLEEAVHPLYALCERARREGVVVVSAAHNSGGRAYPAWLEPVLAVEAGAQTSLLDYAFRPGSAVECSAAALGVPLRQPDGTVRRTSGNSTAAATMSGIVARCVEVGARGLDDVRHVLALTASPPADVPSHHVSPSGSFS